VRWRLHGSEVGPGRSRGGDVAPRGGGACMAVRWAQGAHVVVMWRLGEVAPAVTTRPGSTVLSPKTEPLWSLSNNRIPSCRKLPG
jgi:hypothetical protein